MNITPELAGLAGLVMVIVAGIRKHAPKIDGWVVLVLALIVTVGVVLASSAAGDWRTVLQHIAIVFAGAVGTNAWVGSMAERTGQAATIATTITTTIPPPAPGTVIAGNTIEGPPGVVVVTPGDKP